MVRWASSGFWCLNVQIQDSTQIYSIVHQEESIDGVLITGNCKLLFFFKCQLWSSFSLFLCRHMLNVTWEHKDFSFNNNGYLVNPAMTIITLDRERQWDKVSLSQYVDKTLWFLSFKGSVFVCTKNVFSIWLLLNGYVTIKTNCSFVRQVHCWFHWSC